MQRDELLALMRSMRAELEGFVAMHAVEPGAVIGGGWTLHDAVAHVALWDRMAVRKITGEPLPEGEDVASREPWNLDAFNDEMRARMTSRPMSDVLTEFDAAWLAIVRAVEGANEADCRPGERVWEAVDDDSVGHYPRHFPIRDLLREQQRPSSGDS
jgi:hypothetical protein